MITYITIQPDVPRFIWEIRVQLVNLQNIGVDLSNVQICFAIEAQPSQSLLKLIEDFSAAKFFIYKDERLDKSYIPSLKPYIFAKHLIDHTAFCTLTYFYMDSDVILKSPICESDSNQWQGSETGGYLSTSYIDTKGEGLLEEMAKIVGLDANLLREKFAKSTPGAQWLIHKPFPHYWLKVYEDCKSLYSLMLSTQNSYKEKSQDPNYTPIQAWTAEMWAQAWNLLFFDIPFAVSKDLDFCWATDPIERWSECNIFHNAGVVNNHTGLFFKGDYVYKDPFSDIENINVEQRYCSYIYKQEIIKAKEYFNV